MSVDGKSAIVEFSKFAASLVMEDYDPRQSVKRRLGAFLKDYFL
jgi:hypothetical protein